MTRSVLILLLVIASLLSLSSSKGNCRDGAEEVLVFGILARRGEEIEKHRFYHLKNYLEKRLSFSIEFRFLPFEELKKQALDGRLNFILTNPYQAMLIREMGKRDNLNYRIILSVSQYEGDNYYPFFGGVIFAKKDSPVEELRDLRGEEFGAVDPESFGGYLIALYELHKAGIGEGEIRPKFYGTHDEVVRAVLRGEVTAGTVRTGILERLSSEGLINLQDLKILNKRTYEGFPLLVSSELYPEWPVLALEGTPHDKIKALAQALLEIGPNSELAKRMEAVFYLPLDYSPVEKLLLDLMKGPYAELGELYFKRFKEKYLPLISILLLFFLIILAVLSYTLFVRNRLLRETKESLEREKTFLDTVLKHSDFMVFYLNTEGKVIWANYKGEKICFDGNSQPNSALWEMCPSMQAIRNLKNYFKEMQYQEGPSGFIETVSEEERERTYEGEFIPIRKRNQVKGILFFLRDVTEKLILERQKLFLEKLNLLRNIAGGLAHDFNNKLFAVMNQLELLKAKLPKRKLSPEVRTLFHSLQDSLMGLRLLGRELLTLVRGEEPVKEKADLEDLIRHYTTLVLAGKRNYEVQYDVKRPLPLVEVDKELFSIMWMNLVLNAIEAMPQGGTIKITIEPLTKSSKNYIRFSITDQGPGLPEKYRDRIFEPFFTTKPGGTGLGLYVVMEVVKAHSGTISVASKPDAGTTFTIEFPALEERQILEKDAILLQRKPRVLLMDDDDLVRDTLKELLEQFNYEVETAPNGESALEVFLQAKRSGKHFDFAILDLLVPGRLNGLETLQKLKEYDPDLKIILVSGYLDRPLLKKFNYYGVYHTLIKPFTIQQLLELLEK